LSGPLRDRPERPRPRRSSLDAEAASRGQARARRPETPDGPGLLGLQRDAGNAAVAGLFGQRQVAAGAGMAAPAPAPAATATATAHPTLRLGDKDAEVGVLQEKLNAILGWSLPVTAVFDAGTQWAVLIFQIQHLNDPAMLAAVAASAWNVFKAVEATTGTELQINFNLVTGTGPDAHDVTVVAPPTTGRANAGQWYFADPNAASTVPHEFGHLIGLVDEYQQSAADYTRSTGHEPYVAAAAATDGASADLVAIEQRTAVLTKSSAQAFSSVTSHGVKEGAFAQSVVQEYGALFSGADLVDDLDVNLPDDPAGGPIPKYDTIQVFTYTSGSLMGDPSRHPDPHDHGVQPRHVMGFVEIIQQARGGTWKAMAR
jgi:hypothetical protein